MGRDSLLDKWLVNILYKSEVKHQPGFCLSLRKIFNRLKINGLGNSSSADLKPGTPFA
jgi:hypothetical protein